MLLSKHFSAYKIKKNEIGGECGTYREEDSYIQGFSGGNLSETDHLEDLDLNGRTDGRTCSPNKAFLLLKERPLTGFPKVHDEIRDP
jgi:hypothetical protein